ncbi:hypothetical protein [Thiothrix winogradskyi]|uniref:Phage protein n=1 Tax=Thiothrix winogradskyi TaxID=96472 RepID=A0ABY3T4S2_9GAMM|nr:hypothetical protein [Thiothrix winogradskyi]UJS26234.1 hypothetical protein L2Y54_09405 [Thiothrix winogradskyi]
MKNKLVDLNNHLFAQLERLGDEDLKGDALASEIERSRAITGVAKQLVQIGQLALDAEKFKQEHSATPVTNLPEMLESK